MTTGATAMESGTATSNDKRRVLFLCTGNSARSQMAEALLRTIGGEWFDSYSAGTDPRPGIHPMSIEVMRELGTDLGGQRPKDVRQFLGQDFDFIITVCDRAKDSCPTFPGDHEQIHWSLPDPAEAPAEEQTRVFRAARDGIQTRIQLFIEAHNKRPDDA